MLWTPLLLSSTATRQVIPEGICLGLGEIPGNDRTSFIEQTGSGQVGFQSSNLVIERGLGAIHIEVRGIRMASHTGSHIWREGVVGIRTSATHMAGDAGIFNCGVVWTRGTSNSTGTTDAQDHVSLGPMMRAKAGGDCNRSICCRGRDNAARLVTVDAQIARSSIVGGVGSIHCHRSGGCQGEITLSIGGMDFVAGATILLSGVRISSRLVGSEASSQIREETATRVAAGATRSSDPLKRKESHFRGTT